MTGFATPAPERAEPHADAGAVAGKCLSLLAPSPLDQRTGGYRYDNRMLDGLASRGWCVGRLGLEGRFPDPDDLARRALTAALSRHPDDARVIVDGLAMAGLPEPIAEHANRLRIVALVHHPVAEETGLDPSVGRRLAALETRALAGVQGVIVTSAFTRQALVAEYRVDPARVRVACPGTEPTAPATGPTPGSPPQLLVVASITPRKGHDVLVRSLARLRDRDWTCICAGSLGREAGFAREVQAAVARAGLSERIRFVGECDETALDSLYDGCSIFVLPSRYEGYGMVLTEALARGLPIVSTTAGAIPSTVPGDAALLVPSGDDGALADALATLLDNDQRRATLAAGARRHAASLADWDAAVSAFERCLLELTPSGGKY